MPKRRASRGFTLTEAMIAVSILSVAVLAIVRVMTVGHMQTHEADRTGRATALAEAMVDRVIALSYHDPDPDASTPGPESDELGPADFDNADDYHGYEEAPGELTDLSGTAYPGAYQHFHRQVTAAYDSMDIPGLGGTRPGLRVTVTVRDDHGRSWRLQRFIPEPAESP